MVGGAIRALNGSLGLQVRYPGKKPGVVWTEEWGLSITKLTGAIYVGVEVDGYETGRDWWSDGAVDKVRHRTPRRTPTLLSVVKLPAPAELKCLTQKGATGALSNPSSDPTFLLLLTPRCPEPGGLCRRGTMPGRDPCVTGIVYLRRGETFMRCR